MGFPKIPFALKSALELADLAQFNPIWSLFLYLQLAAGQRVRKGQITRPPKSARRIIFAALVVFVVGRVMLASRRRF